MCCTNATGKGRARVLGFLTIVNILYSVTVACYIKMANSLARAIAGTVAILDTSNAGADQCNVL